MTLSIGITDNGREFVNEVVDEVCNMWPGVQLVHGRPRHSQSQVSQKVADTFNLSSMANYFKTSRSFRPKADQPKPVILLRRKGGYSVNRVVTTNYLSETEGWNVKLAVHLALLRRI